jgi:hypothetical protein
MPVLVEAIELMRLEGNEHYSDYRWYKALLNRLILSEVDIKDPALSSAMMANKVYGDIMLAAMSVLKQKLDDMIYSEEPDFGGID